MSRGGENYYREPVKVVIIDTQYVETDASNFKSVVQNLTGKDAVILGAAKSASKKRSLSTVVEGGGGGGNRKMTRRMPSFKSLDRGLSSKDLDRLLMEFTAMDELCGLCSD